MSDPYSVPHRDAILESLEQLHGRHAQTDNLLQELIHKVDRIEGVLVTVQSDLNADDAQFKTLIAQFGTIATNLTNWFAANPDVDTSAIDADVAALSDVATSLQAVVPASTSPATPGNGGGTTPAAPAS
jgi:hypothetical protein